jgi:hypothetical protein
MAPHWSELVAWAALAVGFASALVIAADIALLAATSAASGSSGRAAE